jgi:glycosyltransferase involved in cell wall biosynthesis
MIKKNITNTKNRLKAKIKQLLSTSFNFEDDESSLFNSIHSSRSGHDLVVFSHLRWGFVTQRPQHLINRMAKDRKVLFIEEPVDITDDRPEGTADLYKENANLHLLAPHLNWKDWDDLSLEYIPIVQKYIKELNLKNPIFWFYSPNFVGVLNEMLPSLVVFDAMDELSAFKGADQNIVKRERMLLASTDIVFTGGKSLYESKKKHHDNVYCFPSSVDRAHFAKALDKSTEVPADIANIKNPIVGYYGVFDERIDLDLLDKVSKFMPEVSFVMIGPVVKINEEDLPKAENIHYLGGKKYDELPNYLKAFDIAMMPFAMNDSTKFISPTKTLEYMAAKKPIISSPIYDVVRDYSKEVSIVNNAEEFINSIKKYMAENNLQKRKREHLEMKVLEKTSWDNTASQMKEIINKALQKMEAPLADSSLNMLPLLTKF